MSKNVPVNAGKGVRGQLAYQAELANEQVVLVRFIAWLERQDEDELDIERINIRFPQGEGEDYLAMAIAWVDGEKKIAFNGGVDLKDALWGLLRRIHNKSIKWKVDQYAK